MSKENVSKKQTQRVDTHSEDSELWGIIAHLPVSLGASLAVFGVFSVLFLLIERFNELYVLGVGLPAALLTFFFVSFRSGISFSGKRSERRIVDILALLFVLGWGVFNGFYTAQTVYLYRDPGLYNSTARWLIDNDDIVIPSDNPFGDNELLRTTSNAGVNMIDENPDQLYTHGLRLLPTLSATTGRLIHESAALKINVVIGALALLSVYGFTRLFAKPRWALLTTAVLSLSLPMLYFSRDMYTEPLSMLFIFTTLSLLLYARASKNASLWLLAGFVAGATLMTRIDAYLGLAGIVAYLAIYLFVSTSPTKSPSQPTAHQLASVASSPRSRSTNYVSSDENTPNAHQEHARSNRGILLGSERKEQRRRIQNIGRFYSGLIVSGVIAWLDLTKLGTAYYRFHEDLVFQQLALLVAFAGVGALACVIRWKSQLLDFLFSRRFLAPARTAALVLTVAAVGVLYARPLLVDGVKYYEVQIIGGTESIVAQDRATEDAIAYDLGEQVILWPTWYLGLALSIVAFFGLLLFVRRATTEKNLSALPFLFSFLLVALLYLYSPSITRDHIWASRRILPVIMPGIGFLAAYFLSQLQIKSRLYQVSIYLTVTIVFMTSALQVSGFFLTERSNAPLLTQVNDFCEVLPDDSAVLLVGTLGLVGVQTIHSYCQIPTVRQIGTREPTRDEFIDFYNNAIKNQKVPVVAAFGNDIGLYVEGSFITRLAEVEYKTVEKVFAAYPERVITTHKEITYGFLSPDGRALLTYSAVK